MEFISPRVLIRSSRILLYLLLFGTFVVLFAIYGNVSVGGTEYFSPTSNVLLIGSLLLLISALLMAFVLWINNRELADKESTTEVSTEDLDQALSRLHKEMDEIKNL